MAFDNPDIITIDPEFQVFIPPLTDDEYSDLEQKLLNEGVTEPLKIWVCEDQDILIDGHNRYRIIQEHGLDMPEPVYIPGLKTRDDVKLWMIKNQVGRRNLTDFAKNEIGLKYKEIFAKLARERQLAGVKIPDDTLASIEAKVQKGKTAEFIAQNVGTNKSSVERTEKILKEATPEVIEKVRSGEMSQNAALKTLKKEEKPERPADVGPTGQTEEELMAEIAEDAPTLEELVDQLSKENDELNAKIDSLNTSEQSAEILRLQDIIFSHSQNIGLLTYQKHQMDNQLRYNKRLLADIRKLLGVDMNSEIINAIKALKGM